MSVDPYKINTREVPRRQASVISLRRVAQPAENHLDEEDRNLLDRFYKETRAQDPFESESFSSQSLWDEMRDKGLLDLIEALDDSGPHEEKGHHNEHFESKEQPMSVIRQGTMEKMVGDGTKVDEKRTKDWILDGELKKQSDYLALKAEQDESSDHIARYSPTIRLLTSYNPLHVDNMMNEEESQLKQQTDVGEDRIVGATLLSSDRLAPPKVVSKSPLDAIKMHNEMFEPPPKDGKVRVRMYFHRAMHDDVRLYGNGPWKYWGHGWGVEYGYDPMVGAGSGRNDFYQKGYTIERAYGRDFCKDGVNCRPSDPDFFHELNQLVKHNS